MMDCRTARELLEASRPERRDWQEPELRAAADHASHCAACSRSIEVREVVDRRIATVMRDVTIPAGFAERLVQALEPGPATALPSRPQRSRRAALRAVGGLAASLLLLAGGWWIWFGRTSSLSLQEVYASLNAQFPQNQRIDLARLQPFDGSFSPDVDDLIWQDVIGGAAPLGLDLDGRPGDDAAAYRFVAGRTGGIAGVLLVLDAAAIADPPTESVPTTQYSRYNPRPQVAWRKGKHVYICVLERGTLDGLKRELYGGTA